MNGIHRGRATPQIKIHGRRNRLICSNFTNAASGLVAKPTGHHDFANLATVSVFDRLSHARVTTALRTGLANPIVLARSFDNPSAFANIMAHRLFNIHIFSCLQCPYRHQRMPMIWGCNAYYINRLIIQKFTKIFLELRCFALNFFNGFHGIANHCFIAITNGGNHAIVLACKAAHMAHTSAINPNHSHPKLFARSALCICRLLGLGIHFRKIKTSSSNSCANNAIFYEFPAIHEKAHCLIP